MGLALAVLVAWAGGCGEQQAPEARNALNAAFIIPTTGDLSSFGRQCRRGGELAWHEASAGRLKAAEVPLWLNIRDDHADTRAAARTARQLYDVAHFLAIIGPVARDTVEAAAREMLAPQVTVLTPTVESADLRSAFPNVIQLCLTTTEQGRLMARFVVGAMRDLHPGSAKALVVVQADDPGSLALADGFAAGAAALAPGFQTVRRDVWGDAPDVAGVVEAVVAEKSGVVVAAVDAEVMGALLPALRQAGQTVPILGGAHAYARNILAFTGAAMGETYVAAHFAPDDERPQVRAFVQAYAQAYDGEVPSAAAALTYDAVKLLDAALRRAMPGGTDDRGLPAFPSPEAVGRALRDGRTADDTVTGPITIHEDGRVTKPLVILKLDETGAHFHARVEP